MTFADKMALLSHKIQDMRDKTPALEVQGAKVDLKINATKTKLMPNLLVPNVAMV